MHCRIAPNELNVATVFVFLLLICVSCLSLVFVSCYRICFSCSASYVFLLGSFFVLACPWHPGLQGCWLADRIPRNPEVIAVAGARQVIAGRLDWSLVAGAVLLVQSAEVALPLAGLL